MLTKRPFVEAARRFPNQREALLDLYRVLDRNSLRFTNPEEMRHLFPSLDNFIYRDKWWVLDVGGKHLRMIACIQFRQNRLFVKHIVTHAEYDRLCDHYRRGKL